MNYIYLNWEKWETYLNLIILRKHIVVEQDLKLVNL